MNFDGFDLVRVSRPRVVRVLTADPARSSRPGGKLPGGRGAQGAEWAVLVGLPPAALDLPPEAAEAGKPVPVRALIPQPALERLDERTARRLPGRLKSGTVASQSITGRASGRRTPARRPPPGSARPHLHAGPSRTTSNVAIVRDWRPGGRSPTGGKIAPKVRGSPRRGRVAWRGRKKDEARRRRLAWGVGGPSFRQRTTRRAATRSTSPSPGGRSGVALLALVLTLKSLGGQ